MVEIVLPRLYPFSWNHFELREYDAGIGRWTTRDPKKIGFSPYIGMYNNPLNGLDIDDGGPPPTDFVNSGSPDQTRHIDDGKNDVVFIDNNKWFSFTLAFDMTAKMDKTSRVNTLAEFGITYKIDDIIAFSDRHEDPSDYEWGGIAGRLFLEYNPDFENSLNGDISVLDYQVSDPVDVANGKLIVDYSQRSNHIDKTPSTNLDLGIVEAGIEIKTNWFNKVLDGVKNYINDLFPTLKQD